MKIWSSWSLTSFSIDDTAAATERVKEEKIDKNESELADIETMKAF